MRQQFITLRLTDVEFRAVRQAVEETAPELWQRSKLDVYEKDDQVHLLSVSNVLFRLRGKWYDKYGN